MYIPSFRALFQPIVQCLWSTKEASLPAADRKASRQSERVLRQSRAHSQSGGLAGRVAIVTGGAQGIGKAIVDELARDGATVVVADINERGAKQAAPAGGMGMKVDVANPPDVKRMIDETLKRYKKLDILVNNAAIVPYRSFKDLTFSEWRKIISVNLDALFLTCKAAYEPMKQAGFGRIINIASNAAAAGTPNLTHYGASKGGVIAFSRSLAREIGKDGITVNCVSPGLTATEGVLASPHKDAIDFVKMLQCIPRPANPSDIAPVVAFLATPKAGWITGQNYTVDGGHTHS